MAGSHGAAVFGDEVVEYVAAAVRVPALELAFYEWDGRTSKDHRTVIRTYTGFRECSVPDAEKAAEWLATKVCESERRGDRVRAELLAHLKEQRIEPPTGGRMGRIIGSALEQSEKTLTLRISARVPEETVDRMLELIARRVASSAAAGPGTGQEGEVGGSDETVQAETDGGEDDEDVASRPRMPGRDRR